MASNNEVTIGGIQQALKNIEIALKVENLDQLIHTRDVIHEFNEAFRPTLGTDEVIGTLPESYLKRGYGNPPVGTCR